MRALALCLVLAGCTSDAPVVVFAAASTADLAQAVADRSGHSVVVSAAATSTLARQIAAGAPADVFVAADGRWLDWLEAEGVGVGARTAVARGRLVVVGAPGRPRATTLAGALAGTPGHPAQRIALGDPEHVPSGVYARAALERAALWGTVRDRVIPQADARAALAAVETGAADLAVVYASDARASGHARVVYEIDAAPPVVYEAAVVGGGVGGEPAFAVLDSLRKAGLWRAHGFEPLP